MKIGKLIMALYKYYIIILYYYYKLWKKSSTLHTVHYTLQKFLNSTHCKILEWQVMNEKMNSNSMQNMYKNNLVTSVLIQERARLNLTIYSLMVVF